MQLNIKIVIPNAIEHKIRNSKNMRLFRDYIEVARAKGKHMVVGKQNGNRQSSERTTLALQR